MKGWIWGCVLVFSTLGGMVPMLWGESALSLASVVGSTVGGLFGVWAGYRLSKRF